MDSWERFTAGRGVSKLRVVWGVSVFIALRAYTRPGNAPPSSRAGGGMAAPSNDLAFFPVGGRRSLAGAVLRFF